MEHLLFGGGPSPILFSYLCSEHWDSGDFLSYPKRAGWDASIWDWSEDEVRLDTKGRSFDELASFLQAWLFFGLLEIVLLRKCDAADFTCVVDSMEGQRRVITTSNLTAFLDEYIPTIRSLSGEELPQREDLIWDALSEAMIVNNRLSRKIYFAPPDAYPGSDLLQETLLCQTLLYLALARYMSKVVDTVDWMSLCEAGAHPFLEKAMKKAGWCPFDIDFLRVTFEPDVVALVFSLGSSSLFKDHSRCHDRFIEFQDHCMAGLINSQNLPKHVANDCNCPLLGPNMEEVATALRNGRIPIVALSVPSNDAEDIDILLWEAELTDTRLDMGEYFAISHVWSEGLGNTNANLLPKCQVKRLSNTLISLETAEQAKSVKIGGPQPPGHRLTIPFWIDAFCIPVSPKLQDLRDLCIARMRKIYESATAVIALDPNLQRLPGTSTHVEVLGRMISCTWRSRLWTFQEGNLTWSLLVPTQDETHDVDKIFDSYPEFEDPKFDPTDGTSRGFLESSLTRSMVKLSRLLIRNSVAIIEVTSHPEVALTKMLRALAHRMTSRDGDETICVATFMNIDPTPLLAEAPHGRMRRLICMLPVLSKAMLFAYGPRLAEPGFQWAPKTFLAPHGYRQDFDFPLVYKPDDNTAKKPIEIPTPYLCQKGRGLIAMFSGIQINPLDTQPLPEHFMVMTSADNGFVVDVNDAGYYTHSWSDVCGDPTTHWAILFAHERKLGSIPDALLVEWLGKAEDGPIMCKWKYQLVVQKLDDGLFEGARLELLQRGVFQGHHIPLCEWVID